ncbi:MAG: GNAT family N-acetyltransferase [Planctomycetes bacterium]|jgi:ribosomal protein S18 acetylase RimI-like enzyme|nr:GNAT family N-acetyltransferase [Planctomycetota bacterium]
MSVPTRLAVASDADHLIAFDHVAATDPRRSGLIRLRVAERNALVVPGNDDLPVGFALINPFFFDHDFIELVYIHPAHRRQGLGTALVARCERESHTEKLFTSTNRSNTAMQALLTKRGFIRSGVVENLDEDDEELIFLKRLPDRAG